MPDPGQPPQATTPPGQGSPTAGSSPPIPIPDHTLVRRIGKGSYGEVWLARNVLGIHRAIKIVHRAAFDDDRPFERELAGIQRFEPISRSHESQLNILHVGRSPGCFYYIMELADDMSGASVVDEGNYSPRTLRSELLLHGRLPVDECLRLGLALTTALEHLHRHQLIHRDVKPSNIVFVNGIPKLADIGLVARTDSTRSFVGTEGYLPPEGPGTPQADIFSLGKVLYELSTGLDRQQFPELPTNVTELPDRAALGELNEVLVRACATDARDRYQSAAEMHADLALLQSGRSVARLRATEQRLKHVARAGALVTALAVIAGAAFLYQQARTREAMELATRNQQLAAEKTRLAAEKTELATSLASAVEESRERLVRLNIANGVRLLDEGDPGGALLWFAEALPLLANHPTEASIHRIRIQQTLRITPTLEQVLPHPHPAEHYIFSPDGRRIATSANNIVRIWDAESGESLGQPVVFPWSFRTVDLAFTPDSRRLMASTPGRRGRPTAEELAATNRAAIIDVASGNIVFDRAEANWAQSGFTPDGRWLITTGPDHVVTVTDVGDGRAVARLPAHAHPVFHIDLGTNGTIASATSEGEIRVSRVPSGEELGAFRVPGQLLACAMSQDGDRVLSTYVPTGAPSDQQNLQVWDVPQRAALGPPIRFDSFVGLMAVDPSPTHRIIAAHHRELSIYDARGEPRRLKTLQTDRPITAVGYAWSNNAIALASGDASVGLWDLTSGLWDFTSGNRPVVQFRHGLQAGDIDVSSDGSRLITSDGEGLVTVWRLKRHAPNAVIQLSKPLSHRHPPTLLERLSENRRRLVISTAGSSAATVLDLETLEERPLPVPPGRRFHRAAIDPTGERWAIAWAATNGPRTFLVQVWNGWDSEPQSLHLPRPGDMTMTFDGDGSRLITECPGEILIWRVPEAMLERTIPVPERFAGVMLSSDGRAALRIDPREGFELFGLREEDTGHPIPLLATAMFRLAVDDSGERFVMVTQQQWARVFSMGTGEPLTPELRHAGPLTWAEWSPDGRRIVVTGHAPEARVWDATTGELALPPLMLGSGGMETASWSADGRFIVARSDDQLARVWDASTGEPVTPALRHSSFVPFAQIAATNRLVTISLTDVVQAWDLTETDLAVDVLRDYAAVVSGRRLNPSGVMVALPAAERAELHRSLRTRAPQLWR